MDADNSKLSLKFQTGTNFVVGEKSFWY